MNRNFLPEKEQIHQPRYCNIILGVIFPVILLSLIFSLLVQAHASAKTVVLLPLKIYADQSKSYLGEGVKSMLLSRLSGGDIEVISDEKVASLLGEKETKGITLQKRAEDLARRLEADYAIFGSITAIGGGYSLDLSLLQISQTGSTVKRVSKAVDEDQFIPQLSDVAYQLRAIIEGREIPAPKAEKKVAVLPEAQTTKGLFSKVEQEKPGSATAKKGFSFRPTSEYQEFKPTGTISVDMAVMAFDLGDLDGDRMAEFVVLGRKSLSVYQRHGASFALRDTLKASGGEEFLKVSVGDVDANGKAEIYLVGLSGQRARCTVLEWNGGFKRLYRQTGHLQAVKDPAGGKPLLLFQDSTVTNFFRGKTYLMGYDSGGSLTKGEELPGIRGAQFYTVAHYDLDSDGNHEWLGLGEDSRLYVWDQQGKVLWKGDKKIGGTNNAINIGEVIGYGEDPPLVPFNSRLLITDIDGDGNREILVIKNIPLVGVLPNLWAV
ncbi:MAG: VCBS repeat-containing protein, partial [Proteobacteria bacterium]|nr:VCBS repeat-containing protein [Pseudomonadota bacterium]